MQQMHSKSKKAMRVVLRTEDAIKRPFTYWQIIAFCLTFITVRDEKYFGICYDKLVVNRMIFFFLWVLWSNTRCLHSS